MNEYIVPLEFKGVQALVFRARGTTVILDEDLARLFGTTTKALNQQVKRNIERFEERFVFRLTGDEHALLRSQDVTAKGRRGGRRNLPWAFTEHGVPMAASVLRSPRAVEAMKVIVDVFVASRSQMLSGAGRQELLPAGAERRRARSRIHDKITKMAELLLDAEINRRDHTTVKDEAEKLATSVLDNVKAQLQTKAIQNEEIVAEIHRRLAEAEKLRAEARKTNAEADQIDIKNLKERLEIFRSLEDVLDSGDIQPVLETMDALAKGNGRVLIDITSKAPTGQPR